MRAETYEVIIVGARVAGATLAALLGDAGLRVLLVDRASFPSSTLSTHFFRGGRAGAVLQRLGVLESVLALGTPRLVCEYRYTNGPEPSIEPPQAPGDVGYSLSVRREPLDMLLVERALATGKVRLLQQCAFVRPVREGERVVGADLQGDLTVRARWLVGADGRHSSVARALAPRTLHTEPGHRAMYYRYVRGFLGPDGVPPQAAEFDLLGDELAYALPSDAGVTCVALSVSLAEFERMRQSPETRFMERLAAHPGVGRRVLAAKPVGRVFGCATERNYARVPSGPGWALVGDAALHQDPWSGVGIDNAMVHAASLADALLSNPDTLEDYHRRRDADALDGYRRTVAGSRDLRNLIQ